MLYTTDFPARVSLSIVPSPVGQPRLLIHAQNRLYSGEECASVWARRTFDSPPPADFASSDQKTIENECHAMKESFLELLCPSALWVNPLRSRACSKPAQLTAAISCGFRIPQTLVSNDPAEIMAFIRRAPGRVVYKTFGSLVPTTILTEEMIAEPEILRWTPGIYQHYVEKLYEIRVTVIGRKVFPVRINSQETARGRVDWREAQRTPRGKASDLTVCRVKLSQSVTRKCLALMRALGLVFGAIDLIATPTQEAVFIEVNEAGQFLWIEEATGLPLVDHVSEMLIHGGTVSNRKRYSPCIRFEGEVVLAAERRRKRVTQAGG
jgi:hypothetical protein